MGSGLDRAFRERLGEPRPISNGMNVTELARKLKIPTKELLEILPAVGFGIGRRAIKIDNRQAQRIIEQWSSLLAKYKEVIGKDETEEKAEEKVIQEKKSIAIPNSIRVKDFAQQLNLPSSKIISELMKNGVLSSMNEKIDFDTASIVGSELGFEIIADKGESGEQEDIVSRRLEVLLSEKNQSKLKPRPPVVVVMGHVDHGKTKLLDTIRKTNVIDQESGGITQHIGAYQVMVSAEKSSAQAGQGISRSDRDNRPASRLITFIDTPGHEAFTTMRSRGARVADVAVLVIAADDGIKPQTKESIKIIKSAGLPMVVAINKIDKPDANQDKIKQDLAAMNLTPEEWGGKTIIVPISAKQGTGIDELLEIILLLAETEKDQIRANPDSSAVGTIIEAHIDKGEGPVASVLIQNGTLKKGDFVEVADSFYGRIRTMKDFKGKEVSRAEPSMPVKVLGLKAVPSVGDILQAVSAITKKKKINKYKLNQAAVDYTKLREISDDDKKNVKSLNIVLKSDVLGSLEAIINSLTELDQPEVSVNIISKGLGNITEGDIERAEASSAWIIGFHVNLTQAADNLAKEKKVEISRYDIIYKLIEEVTARVEKMLSPEVIRTDLGRLKVLATFNEEKGSIIVGGKVTKGKIIINAKADVIRDKRKMATGNITQIQLNKVDVNEADEGKECGIKFVGKPVIVKGDFLEVYQEEIKDKGLRSK